jgi:hypothetical protein
MAVPTGRRSLDGKPTQSPPSSVREERLLTAAITLAASLALNAGGLLLLQLTGGVGVLFGSVLCCFGVTGCVQSILIATGHRQPSDGARERSPGPR